MMGIAAWLIWRSGGFRSNRTALMLYLVQLVLNALWSWIFFAWQSGFWAFADILVLWVLIIATLVSFWRVRPLAGGTAMPLPAVGNVCICPELFGVAAQSPDPWLMVLLFYKSFKPASLPGAA